MRGGHGYHLCTYNSIISRVTGTLSETAADKIRDYRANYNNRPSNAISFVPAVASTFDRLHCELVRILFLQTHWETDCFFCCFRSSVCSIQPVPGDYRRATF